MKNRKIAILIGILILISMFTTVNIRFDGTNKKLENDSNILKASASISVLWTFSFEDIVLSSPALGDVDDDGKLEVVVGSRDPKIYVLNGEDGSELWSYTVAGIDSSPALGDIDNDDKLEVVVGCGDNKIYALNGEDGSQLWNFSKGNNVESSPALGDIDGDNILEVIVGSYDNKVYALNGEDGTQLWNYTTGDFFFSSPALGDVDYDGKLEVVIGCRDKKIYALNGEDGSEVWIHTLSLSSSNIHRSSAALGDIDGDNKLEVLIGSLDDHIYALNGEDGSELWNYTTGGNIQESSPALGDIDDDGILEVIVGSYDNKVYALNGEDGTVLWNYTTGNFVGSSPALGDVDGDNKLEVVVGSHDHKVYALNGEDGSESWNYTVGSLGIITAPILGDIDSDGTLEVIVSGRWSFSDFMYALKPTPSGQDVEWQGFSGDNTFQRRKNYNFRPGQADLSPTCLLILKEQEKVIDEITIGDNFDIYVGDSYDDNEIIEVCFSSDDEQDGLATGTWTEWYYWNSSAGDWDANTKTFSWLFTNGGHKEVWAEVRDNNSQSAQNYKTIIAIYNLTRDSRFSVISYYDKFLEFGELKLNIRFHQLTSNEDDDAFKDALLELGFELYDFTKIHACYLLELGDFIQVFDYLESKVPNLFTPSVRTSLEQYLCDDGYIRFTFTTMSNLEGLSCDLLKEMFKYLLDNWIKSKELIKIPYELFKTFESTFRFFFNTLRGSNQYYFRCKVKPGFELGEITFKVLLSIAKNFNFELHRINIENNIISSSSIFDLYPLVEKIEQFYHILKLGFKIFVVVVQGGTNILSDIKLGAKLVTFTLDYFINFEHKILDTVYFIADMIDPPIAKLDLQIKDALTDEILLGYDPVSNSTAYYCDYGFFRGDLESQFALLDISLFPLNVCIINTHLDSYYSLIYLNQSLTFGITNKTNASHIFSYLQSNNRFFTIMNYSETEGLSFNQLEVNIVKQGYSWVLVNITDTKNLYIHNSVIEVFLNGIKINAIIEILNNGLYNITVDSSYIDEELIIVVRKSGWLSDSARVILGSLEVLEESKSMIPGYLPLILILCIIGISIVVRFPNRKKYLKIN